MPAAQWRAKCQPFIATVGTRSVGISCWLPVPDTLRKLNRFQSVDHELDILQTGQLVEIFDGKLEWIIFVVPDLQRIISFS